MPNVTISIYLNDADYMKYVGRKKEINAKAKETIKSML